MSLLSLRKHSSPAQMAKRYQHNNCPVDAETFIEQATDYANGLIDNVIPFQGNDSVLVKNDSAMVKNDSAMVKIAEKAKKPPYRKSTFT